MAYKKCLIATTKNLFDINKFGTDAISSISIDGNMLLGIIPSGDKTDTFAFKCTVSVKKNTNYIISIQDHSYDISNCFVYTDKTFGNRLTYGDLPLKFNSGDNESLVIGFYSIGSRRQPNVATWIQGPQIEEGSTATSYVPYGYLPSYKKLIKANNDPVQLLDKSKYRATNTINGVTFTNNGDGSFTVNGTATARAVFTFIVEGVVMSGGDKICFHKPLNVEAYNKFWCEISVDYTDGSYRYLGDINNAVLKLEKDANRIGGFIVVAAGETVNTTIKPQLFNLTTTYGAGHEPTTVAEFRAKYPNDYYEYNPSQYLISYRKNLITDGSSKNLFNIDLTHGYPSNKAYGADTKRTFTIGTYITGFARNNYYNPDNITNVNVSKGIISFKLGEAGGYGIGIPLHLIVGQTYTVSCAVDNNVRSGIGISYYKEDGTLISYTEVELVANNIVKSFTTPENTYFTVITLYGGKGNNSYVFSNIQLEKGNTATSYVPYQYL